MAEDEQKNPGEVPGPPVEKRPEAPIRVPDRRATRGPAERGYARYQRDGDTPLALAGRVLGSRWRALRERFSRDFMNRTLHIGVSARIFHPEAGARGLLSKNLQYLEESIAQWVMSRDVLVFMIPTVNTNGLLHPSNITLRHYARHLDGLV
ncbi:MAG: gamma-glutamyl-gamma-aminobutyrate hydrolase, partial [Telluria sp.]